MTLEGDWRRVNIRKLCVFRQFQFFVSGVAALVVVADARSAVLVRLQRYARAEEAFHASIMALLVG